MVQRPRPDLRGGCAAMRIPTVTGVKRRYRPPSESRTGVRGRRLDVRDVDVSYVDPTDFDTPLQGNLRRRESAALCHRCEDREKVEVGLVKAGGVVAPGGSILD